MKSENMREKKVYFFIIIILILQYNINQLSEEKDFEIE